VKHGFLITVVLVAALNGRTLHADAAQEGAATTIVVLDFINRSQGDGHDWLGRGLADMAITDLSASNRLTVVDRRRAREIAREFELAAAGALDEESAPQVGKIAKAQWVLFGTFSCRDDQLSIEALLIDATTQQTLRIEQVEGPLKTVFDLEQTLLGTVLDKLDVPMTEEERRRVKLLKTSSLPAFEHYSRSLGLFDRGQWYDALCEARLARQADSDYLKAAAWVAQLFHEVGEPEHALVEYRRLVELDRDDGLPDEVYFRMGVVLEESLANPAEAKAVFQRIVRRAKEYDRPFRITDPARPSRAWDDVGGISGVDALVEEQMVRLQTLARLARAESSAGRELEAAQRYSQIRHFFCTHGMPFGLGSSGMGFHSKVSRAYGPIYWRMVLENRDAALYPPTTLHVLPAESTTAGPDAAPTHGFHKWQHGQVWLAPPDCEFAEVGFSMSGHSSGETRTINDGKVQIDFNSPPGDNSLLFEILQVKPDGAPHVLKLEPGVRVIQTYVHHTDRWKMNFKLRPWVKPAKIAESGWLSVRLLPDRAELLINGKSKGKVNGGRSYSGIPSGRYDVEARWSDGRRRSATIQLDRGQRVDVFLNAHVETVSRHALGTEGSGTYLMTDRTGRIWLLWDQLTPSSYVMNVRKQSDLFCATSSDGVHWSRPRRLPASSLACDFNPVLQQDRRGTFWLAWISDRGPKATRNVWISSSPNGVEWSFPRKLVLPETDENALATWRSTRIPRLAFAVDARNVFWLIREGSLMRSDDAVTWQVDSELAAKDQEWPGEMRPGNYYHLRSDAAGRLILVSDFRGPGNSAAGPMAWRRSLAGRWEPLGYLSEAPNSNWHAGSAVAQNDGSILAVARHNSGLFVRRFTAAGAKSEPLCVESHLRKPFNPSIAPLPGGRLLVAFGSKDGIVAAVFHKEK
jgi:TolB-like protein